MKTLPVLLISLALLSSATASTFTVNNAGDNGSGSLRQAIEDLNAAGGNGHTITFDSSLAGQTITWSTNPPIIQAGVIIDGSNATNLTISGGGSNRVFFIDLPNSNDAVTIQDLTIADGAATGGAGGEGDRYYGAGGGGGLGAGGGLFVNKGDVTATRVVFSDNQAVGGSGGSSVLSNKKGGGSGGGLVGNGGDAGVTGGGGGGGLANPGSNGGNPAGGDGSDGALGGSGSGVAGADATVGGGGGGGSGASGGDGADFGGGGGAGSNSSDPGSGGFGGGGGGAGEKKGNYSSGGFGGGGGGAGGGMPSFSSPGGSGGAYGGDGGYHESDFNSTGAGGGAALGGAIFVRSSNGGSLVLVDCSESGSAVTGGVGGISHGEPKRNGQAGQAVASGMFLLGSDAAFEVSSGQTNTFAGDIVDSAYNEDGSAAETRYGVVKTGEGTMVLTGTNPYEGGTTIDGGVLSVTDESALGSGGITISSGGALEVTGSSASIAQDVVNEGSVFVTGTNQLTFKGAVSGSGNYPGDGQVDFENYFSPGGDADSATIDFGGDVTFDSSSVLRFFIGGDQTGQYDSVSVEGDLQLGGYLFALPLGAFKAAPGDAFVLCNVGGTLSGTFSGVILPADSQAWYTDYDTMGGRVIVGVEPRLPEIAVEQPAGTDIVDGGAKDFGTVQTGNVERLTFTIRNTGVGDLTGLDITIDGADASSFSVTTAPMTSVARSGSTTFVVEFAPESFGIKTAALHIASNDSDENPFEIALSGLGALPSYDNAPIDFHVASVIGTNVSLEWNPGSSFYIIERSTNLIDGTWAYVSDVLLTNAIALTNEAPHVFYRISQVLPLVFSDPQLEAAVWSGISSKYAPSTWLFDVDVEGVEVLDVSSRSVSNMTGVSSLHDLTGLFCGGNSFPSLELTDQPDLQNLLCQNGTMTELTLSGCPGLSVLHCENNTLSELDLTACTNLSWVSCENNSLTNLDLTTHQALDHLNCSYNDLSALDVSGCTNVTALYCNDNNLTALDVSGFDHITTLYCNNNDLTSLGVSYCKDIRYVYCGSNNLTSLDMRWDWDLSVLSCYANNLTSINLTDNGRLGWLYCERNNLTSLNLRYNIKLQFLNCSENALTGSLDLSKNIKLTYVNATSNSLYEIIVADTNSLPATFLYDSGVIIREP